MSTPAPVAILAAMAEEGRGLRAALAGAAEAEVAGRTIARGELAGVPVLLALAGIGKVAAASTATLLLARTPCRALLFTGVAGGLAEGVAIGDIVVAAELIQHDLDASPIFPRWEVPLTGRARFATDAAWTDALARAAAGWLQAPPPALAALRAATAGAPRVHRGLVASGDRFVATAAEASALRAALPDALAVEMEGAAAAQVAASFGVPFACVRSISDRADAEAPADFTRFVADVAAVASREVLLRALAAMDGR